MSSAEPLLPLNWLVAAARLTRWRRRPQRLGGRRAELQLSSQNTTRMPRAARGKRDKADLDGVGHEKSSKNRRAVAGRESGRRYFGMLLIGCDFAIRQRAAQLRTDGPARRRAGNRRPGPRRPQSRELLTICRGRHGQAILLTDQQGWLDETVSRGLTARPGGPISGSAAAASEFAGRGSAVPMGSIDSYIFRTTLASFALVLVSLTGVIWITQALRGIDLMTSQGQTILTFLGITGLVMPAAGADHRADRADDRGLPYAQQARHRFRDHRHECRRHVAVAAVPSVLVATVVVSMLVVFIAPISPPTACAGSSDGTAEITADVLANILQPGRFAQLEQDLTIRVRERQPGGVLVGVFIDDRRDPNERVSIIADHGKVVKNDARHVPGAGRRQPRTLRNGQQRTGAGRLQPLRLRHVEILDAAATSRYRHSRTYLWELLMPAAERPDCAQDAGQIPRRTA